MFLLVNNPLTKRGMKKVTVPTVYFELPLELLAVQIPIFILFVYVLVKVPCSIICYL